MRVTIPDLLPSLMELFPPSWKPATSRKVRWLFSLNSVKSRRRPGSTIHQLYTGSFYLTRGSDFQRIRTVFGSELRAILAMHSSWRTFVHAGAVGWKGRAILLPGSSGSGKTTLVSALVRAGANFLSDEFAVLDRKGRVHPYPLPLRVKTEEGGIRTEQVPVEALGGTAETRPLPVGAILSTRYDPDSRGILRTMSHGRAALALLGHAKRARNHPARVMRDAGTAAEGAICLQGPRGEAEEFVDRVLSLW